MSKAGQRFALYMSADRVLNVARLFGLQPVKPPELVTNKVEENNGRQLVEIPTNDHNDLVVYWFFPGCKLKLERITVNRVTAYHVTEIIAEEKHGKEKTNNSPAKS